LLLSRNAGVKLMDEHVVEEDETSVSPLRVSDRLVTLSTYVKVGLTPRRSTARLQPEKSDASDANMHRLSMSVDTASFVTVCGCH
jgi:hypothetical protein